MRACPPPHARHLHTPPSSQPRRRLHTIPAHLELFDVGGGLLEELVLLASLLHRPARVAGPGAGPAQQGAVGAAGVQQARRHAAAPAAEWSAQRQKQQTRAQKAQVWHAAAQPAGCPLLHAAAAHCTAASHPPRCALVSLTRALCALPLVVGPPPTLSAAAPPTRPHLHGRRGRAAPPSQPPSNLNRKPQPDSQRTSGRLARGPQGRHAPVEHHDVYPALHLTLVAHLRAQGAGQAGGQRQSWARPPARGRELPGGPPGKPPSGCQAVAARPPCPAQLSLPTCSGRALSKMPCVRYR